MHLVRWALLVGWLLLIASLLYGPSGTLIFWGSVVPTGLLLIGVVSHELWRRICPLSFVSQLARALGWQRTRVGRQGRREVVQVASESWLGRHHIALQWSLLIAGLCLRLLVVNASPLGLATLLVLTLSAALLVGWAYGGKAWCQYVCPMGPVQTVLTGLRGPLGSTAHLDTSSRITQSMCRTIAPDGKEQSACVACQAPCIDIDAERAFWQTLQGKRSLSRAWYSYPGLVLAFFSLMDAMGSGDEAAQHPLGYLRSGVWAFDTDLPRRAWLPLTELLPLPRLLLVPLALSLAAILSVFLFQGIERALRQRYSRQGLAQPQEKAVLHSRLLATFLAINAFFWFANPLLGVLGSQGGQLLRSLVLVATSIALFRSWHRDQATYRRESVSGSLRRQLRQLPGLEAALDGRSLEALPPQEVFTLVKALPALGQQRSRSLYRDVMADMLRSGRLDGASALLQLQDVRQTLQLQEADHHQVVRLLARDEPRLLELDQLHRQMDDLRREAAAASIDQWLKLAGQPVLVPERLPPSLAGQLEELQRLSGLDEQSWADLLHGFGPRGEEERRRLEEWRADWLREAGSLGLLAELAVRDPLLRPLHQAMLQRTEAARTELEQRILAAGLPPLPAAVPASGSLDQALDLLWHDPDPDTAGWVLMLARERDPERLARCLQDPRSGLGDSPFLQSQRRGETHPDRPEFPAIAAAGLFADLLPEGVLWVAREGRLLELQPGEALMERGAASDSLALVVDGEVLVWAGGDQPIGLGVGQTVGEIGLITGAPRSASVTAAPQGALLFVLPGPAFEALLERSRSFGRGLLAQLARRVVSSPAGAAGG